MKRFFLLLALLGFTATSYSQLDKSKGSSEKGGISIPAVEVPPLPKPEKEEPAKEEPAKKAEEPVRFPEREKKPFSMVQKKLKTYQIENFTPKAFTKDKEVRESFSKHQNLGDYLTKGSFVELYCRDHEFVDGDKVRVWLNGEIIQHSVTLGGGYTPIFVQLRTGTNRVEFEALNQGSSGPNTAELKLLDESGSTLAQKEWNLLTGARASLVVVKE